jgi:hypothetical protein
MAWLQDLASAEAWYQAFIAAACGMLEEWLTVAESVARPGYRFRRLARSRPGAPVLADQDRVPEALVTAPHDLNLDDDVSTKPMLVMRCTRS